MITPYTFEIEIQLLNDPITSFSRKLVYPCIYINTMGKSVDITWHMQHITPTNVVYDVTSHVQVANNSVLVNTLNEERITIEQYNTMEEKPPCMGEYDYLLYVNKNQPFDIMDMVESFGNVFAERNGWI